jgi:SOS regulatory protein LexA
MMPIRTAEWGVCSIFSPEDHHGRCPRSDGKTAGNLPFYPDLHRTEWLSSGHPGYRSGVRYRLAQWGDVPSTGTSEGKARAITIPGVSSGGFTLPMLGLVSAGQGIEANEQNERLDLKDLFPGSDLFALKVRGTSMIESQIADGDFVVIRPKADADNGEKVVAMIDKAMTLKKFFRKKDQIRLEPCNSTMEPIIVDPAKENVQVLGVLAGVIRKC